MPASAPDIYFANTRTRYKHEYHPLKMGFVRSVLKDANLPFSPNSLPPPVPPRFHLLGKYSTRSIAFHYALERRDSIGIQFARNENVGAKESIINGSSRVTIEVPSRSFFFARVALCSTLFQFQIFKLAENLCSRNGIRGTIRKLNSEPDKLRPPSRCVNIFSSPIFNANCSTRMPISFSFFFIDIEKNIRRH